MTVLCAIGGSKLLTHMKVPHGTLQIDDQSVGIITDRFQLVEIMSIVNDDDTITTSSDLVKQFSFLDNVSRLYLHFRRAIMAWQDDSALQPNCFIIRNSSGGVSAVDEKHQVVVPMVSSFYMFCDEVMLLVQQDKLSSFEGAHLIKKAASLTDLPDKKVGECLYLIASRAFSSVVSKKFNAVLNLVPPEIIKTGDEQTSVLDTIAARQSNTVFVTASIM